MKLVVQGLRFDYTSSPVLEDIDMELDPGEIVGVIGPNGAGKSTLIKCVDRILHPEGDMKLNGVDMKKMNRMELAKCMGYVPQSPDITFPSTVLDTVLMGRRPHSSWHFTEKDIDKALEALEMMGVSNFAFRDYNEISGGQKQRVIIARAIAQETGILLLDEPTSNLDIKHQISLMDVLDMLVKNLNISVIMTIHDLNIAARYSQRLLLMSNGRIVAAGNPLSVLNTENIRKYYGVEALVKEENDIPYIIPLKAV
ncbi:MAG: ABC transporter ATP-binding protein [Methanomethylovorans sp.]|uniref:ABC transporter ATP-binding protein n=1 Tax=Methanomethylovorans sp. TaxID=2758717 RepID=UPI000A3E699D|nr:ABC transporter ATP-binding protein [Methanomethylovorans sp.]